MLSSPYLYRDVSGMKSNILISIEDLPFLVYPSQEFPCVFHCEREPFILAIRRFLLPILNGKVS